MRTEPNGHSLAKATLPGFRGPLTVKEVEARVFLAARAEPRLEAAQRSWMEDDRSYFIRWRDGASGPPLVIGLVYVKTLPEMASEVRLAPFDEEASGPLQEGLLRYARLLRAQLEPEGFEPVIPL